MMVSVPGHFVTRPFTRQIDHGEPAFGKQGFEGAIDGRLAQSRVLPPGLGENFLRRQRSIQGDKGLADGLALIRTAGTDGHGARVDRRRR